MSMHDGNPLAVSTADADRLSWGEHHDPHSILGIHDLPDGGRVLRSYHPLAESCELVLGGDVRPMQPLGQGLFALRVSDLKASDDYRLRFHFADGAVWERGDPYAFLPTIGAMDLYLLGEGTHRQLYNCLGARVIEHHGVKGTAFAVWAPNAKRVSLIADFCIWDGRLLPMRSLGASGVWEIFVPGVGSGALYKFEIKAQSG